MGIQHTRPRVMATPATHDCLRRLMNAVLPRSLWCLAVFSVSALAAAETVLDDESHGQEWTKRGVVVTPGFAGPASSAFVSSPSVVRLENGRLRMYVWVADGAPPWLNGRHVIIAAEADLGEA